MLIHPRLTAVIAIALLAAPMSPQAHAGSLMLGAAQNYGLLFTGYGGNTLHITNTTVTGNIGVGFSGQVDLGGPGTVTGRLDVAAADSNQVSGNNVVISGGVVYNVSSVNTALQQMSALNVALGAVNGASVNINGSTLLNISNGVLASGSGFTNARVFDVTGFSLGNNQTLTLQGNGAGDAVVLNFTSNTNFHGQVALTGGLTPDQVLFNFVGGTPYDPIKGTGGTGGPSLDINNQGDGAHPYNLVQGIFLDPNGAVSVTSARIQGRVFGGDSHDFQYVSGSSLTVPQQAPEPATIALAAIGAASFGAAGLWRRSRSNASA